MSYQRKLIKVSNIFTEKNFPTQPLRESEKDYFRRAAAAGALVDDLCVCPIKEVSGKYLLIHGRKLYAGLRYVSEVKGNEDIKAVCKVFNFGSNQSKIALQYLTLNRGRGLDPLIEVDLVELAMEVFTPEEIHAYSNIPYRHIENLLRLKKLSSESLFYIKTGVLHVMHALTLVNRYEITETVDRIIQVAKSISIKAQSERLSAAIIEEAETVFARNSGEAV